MKKLILLSVCLLSLGLAACGDSSDSSSSNNNPNPAGNRDNSVLPTVPTCSDFNLYLDKDTDGYDGTVSHYSGNKLKLLSKAEIEDMLRKSDPTTTWPTDFYKNKPDYTAPQYAGALNEAALCAGLNRVNTIRRLSGINPVRIDADYTRKAQLGALITYLRNSGISHDAGKNDLGMNDKDFKDGSEALSKGNLGNYDLPSSADEWLKDANHSNVLHRLWMTSPVSAKFGFGYMEKNPAAKKAFNNDVRGKIDVPAPTGYAVLRACDSGNGGKTDWDFVAWPAPGYTPLGLFTHTHVQNADISTNIIYTSYWSIYFRSKSDVKTLILEKLSKDGKTVVKKWGAYINLYPGTENPHKILGPTDPSPADSSEGVFDDKFAVFDANGAGGMVAPTISFIPTDVNHIYADGDKYRVKLYEGYGNATKQYEVEFFTPKP